ncbi:phage portal protein [Bradyrhizobium diazoefficiens]|uniref:Portal protein n=1 Tax=Bradyrhizobium diazoefficiens TaxID=1355477 RepID=A0A809YKQ0_9BRAD|nr:phage portal protein [Bradyrhizobium diazoefficiens]BCA04189.1 portal protein [Bradyrhizobium diazoefficiens]BCA21546.1 portal protein [Bradyrhizobium diazoefficiens]BCE39715.1 portal protein [Bradyrhizobium diazoefficiens]BCF53111.1 portal protein [Bradyrhizobium diazoefficiens]
MGFLSGIGNALRMMADTIDVTAPRDQWDPQYWGALGGGFSTAGVVVNDRTVSQLGAVQSVRYGMSSSLSTLPVSVYRKGPKGSRTALPDHPLTRLLSARPNRITKPGEFVSEIGWHLSYYRNAFARILPPGDGLGPEPYGLGGLDILHPRRLAQIERRYDGRLYYTFNPPATIVQNASLAPETYREDELWHLRGNPLREDGLLGEPVWETARNVFARAIAVHDYGDIWFANYGGTGGIIEHPGTFKDKDAERDFLDTWRRNGTGRNRHRDRLLKYGAKYTQLKVTNSEAQLLETEDAADTAVFGLWSYPPHRAGRLKRSTNNNIEQQSLDFVIYCLAPLAIAIEQAAEGDLLLDNDNNDLFVEFNFAGLLRGDLKTRYAAYLMGRQGEWLSANDILRFENMPLRTDPGGDDYKNPLTKDSGAAAGDTGAGDQQGNGNNDSSTEDSNDG